MDLAAVDGANGRAFRELLIGENRGQLGSHGVADRGTVARIESVQHQLFDAQADHVHASTSAPGSVFSIFRYSLRAAARMCAIVHRASFRARRGTRR